jgi:hypothetical protein
MKLTRHGAKRFSGYTKLFEKKPTILVSNNKVELIASNILDADDTKSTFNYTVELSFAELMKILETVDRDSSYDETISDAFSGATKTLFRLLMRSSGLQKDLKKGGK